MGISLLFHKLGLGLARMDVGDHFDDQRKNIGQMACSHPIPSPHSLTICVLWPQDSLVAFTGDVHATGSPRVLVLACV